MISVLKYFGLVTQRGGADQPYLLKVSRDLSDDCIIVVGDHHLVDMEVQIVELSFLGP